jgi:uncharacterized membrane protein
MNQFSSAEYASITPTSNGEPTERQLKAAAAFPMAVLFGTLAAILGCIGYAMVWSLGFMVSIVAVGMAWLIVKAMLLASNGIGGRLYQVVAVILTYFAVSCGKLLQPAIYYYRAGHPYPVGTLITWALFGPFLRLLQTPFAILGLVILGYAIRAAWKGAAGTPTPKMGSIGAQ